MEDQFKEAFKEETADIISSIGNLLVDLEEEPHNQEYKIALFRHLHTVKGSAGMFGYTKIASLVHDIESVLEPYKQGEVEQISAQLITQLLTSMDFIKFLMDSDEKELDTFDQTRDYLIGNLRQAIVALTPSASGSLPAQVVLANQSEKEPVCEPGSTPEEEGDSREKVLSNDEIHFYYLDLELSEDYVLTGNRPHYLLSELKDLGEMCSFADTSRIPTLEAMKSEKFYLRWLIFLATPVEKTLVEDVFLFVGGDSQVNIEKIGSNTELNAVRIQEAMQRIASFGFSCSDICEVLSGSPLLTSLRSYCSEKECDLVTKVSDQAVIHNKGIVEPTPALKNPASPAGGVSAPKMSANSGVAAQNTGATTNSTTQRIRVDSRRLDSLVDLVGELVTIQARLSQKLKEADYKEIENVAEKLDFIVQELRDVTTEMRMIPIQGTFAKFQRLVRDLSQELGKKVEYITTGGETELDKNIIEKLDEPLVHLIRNSLDHGIEKSQDRLQAGKPEKAVLRISAQQNGANITIQIQDDGAGLNRELIARKAIERGLISSCDELSDEAVYEFIFSPGFSTATQITNLSGRGVGLSVVRSQVESLRGNITIKSQPGKGTTFSMVFPLTLAIIDGFLVRVGKDYFVVPLSIVEACLEFKTEGLKLIEAERGGFMSYRDKALPCLELRSFFEIKSEIPKIQQVVIVRSDQTMIGIVVDEVIGKHQTVIKSLGQIYRNVKGVSSATILGDGSIALLLDIDSIVELNLLQTSSRQGETWTEMGYQKEQGGVTLD